jgi:hypothetical protein
VFFNFPFDGVTTFKHWWNYPNAKGERHYFEWFVVNRERSGVLIIDPRTHRMDYDYEPNQSAFPLDKYLDEYVYGYEPHDYDPAPDSHYWRNEEDDYPSYLDNPDPVDLSSYWDVSDYPLATRALTLYDDEGDDSGEDHEVSPSLNGSKGTVKDACDVEKREDYYIAMVRIHVMLQDACNEVKEVCVLSRYLRLAHQLGGFEVECAQKGLDFNTIKILYDRVSAPLNAPFPLFSDLNGNNGVWTNTDDLDRPDCTEVSLGCKGVRHSHKVRKPLNPAARGYAERMQRNGTPLGGPRKPPEYKTCNMIYDDTPLSCPDPRHSHVIPENKEENPVEDYQDVLDRTFEAARNEVALAQAIALPPYQEPEEEDEYDPLPRLQADIARFHEERKLQDEEYKTALEVDYPIEEEKGEPDGEMETNEEATVGGVPETESVSLPLKKGAVSREPALVKIRLDSDNQVLFDSFGLKYHWASRNSTSQQLTGIAVRERKISKAIAGKGDRALITAEVENLFSDIVFPERLQQTIAAYFGAEYDGEDEGDEGEEGDDGEEGDEGEEGGEDQSGDEILNLPFTNEEKLSEKVIKVYRLPKYLAPRIHLIPFPKKVEAPEPFDVPLLSSVKRRADGGEWPGEDMDEKHHEVKEEEGPVVNPIIEPPAQFVMIDDLSYIPPDDYKVEDVPWPDFPPAAPPLLPPPKIPLTQKILASVKRWRGRTAPLNPIPIAPPRGLLVNFIPPVGQGFFPETRIIKMFNRGEFATSKRRMLDAILTILPGFYKQDVRVVNVTNSDTLSEETFAQPLESHNWAFDLGKVFLSPRELEEKKPFWKMEYGTLSRFVLGQVGYTGYSEEPISVVLLKILCGNLGDAGADLLAREALGVGSKEGTVEYRTALYTAADRYLMNSHRDEYNRVKDFDTNYIDNTLSHFCQIRVFRDVRKMFRNPASVFKPDFRQRGA